MNSQVIVIAVAAVFMGWFAIGMIYNLRRGDRLLKWMQAGLPLIGQRTTFRWLGTSVAELGLARAKRPFQRLDILLVLKPRDIFWMTLLAYFQKRDDVLIFRAGLSTVPALDLELADPATWTGRTALDQAAGRGWESADFGGLRLMAPKGLLNLALKTLERLSGPMQALAPRYVRFSLRRSTPNLEVHLPFPDPRQVEAQAFFQALIELARAASARN